MQPTASAIQTFLLTTFLAQLHHTISLCHSVQFAKYIQPFAIPNNTNEYKTRSGLKMFTRFARRSKK